MYIQALINEAPKKILKVAMILELGVNSIKCYDIFFHFNTLLISRKIRWDFLNLNLVLK